MVEYQKCSRDYRSDLLREDDTEDVDPDQPNPGTSADAASKHFMALVVIDDSAAAAATVIVTSITSVDAASETSSAAASATQTSEAAASVPTKWKPPLSS